jgi:hypothetical protein
MTPAAERSRLPTQCQSLHTLIFVLLVEQEIQHLCCLLASFRSMPATAISTIGLQMEIRRLLDGVKSEDFLSL